MVIHKKPRVFRWKGLWCMLLDGVLDGHWYMHQFTGVSIANLRRNVADSGVRWKLR